jgi:hypothetical protein
MHGRRWRTNVMAESNDMPRLRMRYAITIAAERETPYTRSTHATRQSKSGHDYEGDRTNVGKRVGSTLTC